MCLGSAECEVSGTVLSNVEFPKQLIRSVGATPRRTVLPSAAELSENRRMRGFDARDLSRVTCVTFGRRLGGDATNL